ncbi:hypothetical protein NL676_012538 [Syzygium grande]|nr:hypothetical protein NL676_012538 [Syzygium grande]
MRAPPPLGVCRQNRVPTRVAPRGKESSWLSAPRAHGLTVSFRVGAPPGATPTREGGVAEQYAPWEGAASAVISGWGRARGGRGEYGSGADARARGGRARYGRSIDRVGGVTLRGQLRRDRRVREATSACDARARVKKKEE